MIRQRPSTNLRNTHQDLLLATRAYGQHEQERDVPFLEQKRHDLEYSLQLAIIERLDALLQMTEHRVVDHICKVEGHDDIKKKTKRTPKGKKPDEPKGPDDGEVVDEFLDGLDDGGDNGG